MENKSHALAAGTFVLLLLALLTLLAVWLTRDSSQLQVFELSSREAVTGLQPQAAVRFKGVNVGKVSAIGFDPLAPGQVLIRIAIDDRAPVTQSTFATLGFQGVTGLAFVQLDDSGDSRVALPGGAEPPTRIPLRPGPLARLTDQGGNILTQLEESSQRLNLLLAPENQKMLIGTLGALSQAARGVEQLARHGDTLLPQLRQEASATLQTLQATSVRVGESANEARASARAFRTVTERMAAQGGTLDQIDQGSDTLSTTGQNLNNQTLPRLHRTLDDAARSARQLGRAAETLGEQPQSLIFGHGPPLPGPGEPGFTTPGGTQP